MKKESKNKVLRGNASQFLVAAELCRRNVVAVITLGNCPNTDILASNVDASKFAHIQVKTSTPGFSSVQVGQKAEKDYGPNFFWVLVGLPPKDESLEHAEFYIIPTQVMAKHISRGHKKWLDTPGAKGQKHNPTNMRVVISKGPHAFPNLQSYRDNWNPILECLGIRSS